MKSFSVMISYLENKITQMNWNQLMATLSATMTESIDYESINVKQKYTITGFTNEYFNIE